MPIIPVNPTPEVRRNWKLPKHINVIGISGHAGSGKDTVALMLCSTYIETYCESFADPLKQGCAKIFGIPKLDFYNSKAKEIPNPYWHVSPRVIAQFVGSEVFRDMMKQILPGDNSDFWVRRMYGLLSGKHFDPDWEGEYSEGDTVVIPDVRFKEELEFIQDNHGLHIHITRPTATGQVGLFEHQSESQNFSLTGERTYVIENTGTEEELLEKVKQVVNSTMKLTPYDLSNAL